MRYYSFNTYLREKYGCRVHRLSLDAGFTCPNRDGKAGSGGCIYCNDEAFAPFAGKSVPLDEQITRSMDAARKKYGAQKFIAYFQNATNTYAPAGELKKKYDVIKKYPDIVGLFISTRPDAVDDEKLDLIKSYIGSYETWIEYGLQSVHDKTLELVNRGHTFKETVWAVENTAKRGIKVGAHVIFGLPGESESDMLATIKEVARLPVAGIKFHALHVLKDTPLEIMFNAGKLKLLEMEEYAGIICRSLELLSPECVVFRLAPEARGDVLVAPGWVRGKTKVIRLIEEKLEEENISQGSKYRKN